MPTLAEIQALISDSVGANLTFATELNLVRARLLQAGNWKGAKEGIILDIFTDADGRSIVTLPRRYETILAGAVRNTNVLCSGAPVGIRNGFAEFSQNGLGYGGLTQDFTEVNGRFAVFQEWTSPNYLRFKFETNETTGVIHLIGKLNGVDVFSSYSSAWIRGEKVGFTASTAMVISGGTQDGIYLIIGTLGGKPKYELLGFSDGDTWVIYWGDTGSGNRWNILNGDPTPVYYSISNVATPDLASNWKNTSDDSVASITVLSSIAPVTSSSKFDAVGLSVVKPSTNGRVSVFAVDANGNETAVAVWEPTETIPRLHRFKVPDCSDTDSQYIAIAKLAYVPVSSSDEEVVPGNIAALEKGLEARKAERSSDLSRAGKLWAEAQALLVEESENDTGAAAQGAVQVANDFAMNQVGCYDWPLSGYGG